MCWRSFCPSGINNTKRESPRDLEQNTASKAHPADAHKAQFDVGKIDRTIYRQQNFMMSIIDRQMLALSALLLHVFCDTGHAHYDGAGT